MRKGYLTNGSPVIVVNIKHLLRLSDFARALTDHFFTNSLPFPDKLKKYEGERIIKNQLRLNGLSGMYSGLDDLGENQDEWNNIYSKSSEWVGKSYSHFIDTGKVN